LMRGWPAPVQRRSTNRSITTKHADDDTLNADVVLVHVDGLHRFVGRLQANAPVALAVKLLDRRRRAAEHGDDHLAVISALPLVHDDEIAIADLLVHHRVPSDAKDVMISAAPDERFRNAARFVVLDRLDRQPRGYGAEQRQLDRAW